MNKNAIYRLFAIILIIVLLLTCLATLASCGEETAEATTYLFNEDTVFALNLSESNIMGLPFYLFIDKSSNITIRADGTATLTIKTTKALSTLANTLLGTGFTGDFVLTPFIEMAFEYIPGFSLSDMQKTFDILQVLLGLTFLGFNWDDPEINELFNAIKDTGTLPQDFKLPSTLTLEYTADYYVKDVVSPHTGAYSGIYMGEHSANGEPFILMDYKDIDGVKQINLRLELVKLSIIATEVAK